MPKDNTDVILLPLADPVFSAIFANETVAGLAAGSLVRAVLSDGGADANDIIGSVVSVTPQRIHTQPGKRGCRVDVEMVTDDNEYVIVEVQLYDDAWILQRNLFAASRIFTEGSVAGTTSAKMAVNMPNVITINILDYNIRDDNAEIVQPVKLIYEKPPYTVAMPQFAIYNVQMARFRETEPDWGSGLHCWLYSFDTAHRLNKSFKEVVDMTAQLQSFARRDSGFKQFCERYDMVAADPETRKAYLDWYSEAMRLQGMAIAAERKITAAEQKAIAAEQKAIAAEQKAIAAEQKGELIGTRKATLHMAQKLKLMGNMTPEEISDLTGLLVSEVKKL